ncbi:sensor histidine kinase [Hymenobacter terrenus]|uniref:sensor histidine kinase n=1 Tax=Hymenobacter terrenus TaxID=1629124 RepID=UPI0018CDDCEC|nr:histidine kinase [Hymenobacter terrenus]
MKRSYNQRIDLAIWLGLALVFLLSDLGSSLEQHTVLELAVGAFGMVALAMVPYYLHLTLLNRFFHHRRYGSYLLLTLLLLLVFGWAQHQLGRAIYQNPDGVGVEMIRLLLILLVVTGIRFYRDGLAHHYQEQELQAKQTATELKLLRDQVNPHFLFNTLNNLYSLTLHQAAQAPEVVLKLASLMRYMLEKTHLPSVSLDQELEYLRNYLALEKLRLGEKADIAMHVSGAVAKGTIAPMLLIPLVENAFKHGVAPTNQPARVVLDISLQGDTLICRVTNTVFQHQTHEMPTLQTGLLNLQRRLAILYPNAHELSLENEGHEFQALLEIHLSPSQAAVSSLPATLTSHAL